MNTPICDFVRTYAQSGALRAHMPGHKGQRFLGIEQLDITEIDGADSLYEATGIIRQSEQNASELFGSHTFYSTEGSSQCIRAMLYLAMLHARSHGRRPLIAAGRNAHKTFLSTAALLDLDVMWLYGAEQDGYLSCRIDAAVLEAFLASAQPIPTAVYLTSPDYLGNMADISTIARVCRRHGILLLVDNAHGAYLRFLPQSLHPIDLGADLCCDSAHKTLPVLTGGAYLHIAHHLPDRLVAQAKTALVLFGSTSPSYLILQSLDRANAYLSGDYPKQLRSFAAQTAQWKAELAEHGYTLTSDEPLKLTIAAKAYGYTGTDLSNLLQQKSIICEFADPDYLVLMLTPEIGAEGLREISDALLAIPRRAPITDPPPVMAPGKPALTVRQAMFSPQETIPAAQCLGRVLAAASVGCPPAVPIAICGERLTPEMLSAFGYYGIRECTVVME